MSVVPAYSSAGDRISTGAAEKIERNLYLG